MQFLSRPTTAAFLALAALAAPVVAQAPQAFSQTPPSFATLGAAPPSAETTPLTLAASASMVTVPPGFYQLGREDGPADEGPAHQLMVEGFRIDRTEVTNGAFAEFLNALDLAVDEPFRGGALRDRHAPAATLALLREDGGAAVYPLIALDDDEARIGFADGRFQPTPGYADHPVAETTWAGARAYCRWRRGWLPTEAEWEAAARGTDGRLYPWGDAPPDPERAFVSGRTGETAPVGGRPAGASPFGALDMSGSMAEWTNSLKRPYPYQPEDGRENPTAEGERVTRGGDYRFDTAPETLTATHRNGFSNAPERGHRHIGFRCAAAIERS